MMKSFSLIMLCFSMLLAGCGGDSLPIAEKKSYFEYQFAGAHGLRQSALMGRNADGSLDLPAARAAEFGSPAYAMASLGGWSTTQPIVFSMYRPDDRTLKQINAPQVVVLEYTQTAMVPSQSTVQFHKKLKQGEDFQVFVNATQVTIIPLKPLKPKHGYLLGLTSQWQDTKGEPLTTDPMYKQQRNVAGSWVQFQEKELAQHTSLDPKNLIASEFVFTQDANDSLRSVYVAYKRIIEEDFNPQIIWPTASQDSVFDFNNLNSKSFFEQLDAETSLTEEQKQALKDGIAKQQWLPSLVKKAKIYTGTVKLPYFLSFPNDTSPKYKTESWKSATPSLYALQNPTESLGSGAKAQVNAYLAERNVEVSALFGPSVDARFDEMRKLIGAPLPEVLAAQTGARHTNQFNPLPELTRLVDVPVRIFTNATDLRKVQEFIIFQHGITTHKQHAYPLALYMIGFAQGKKIAMVSIDHPLHGERSMINPKNGKIESETIDSGLYMNLQSLLVGRDNIKQSAADIMGVRAALHKLKPNAPVHFVGHSLGAMTGINALALTDAQSDADQGQRGPLSFTRVILGMPGGGIAPVLMNSEKFSGPIKAGVVLKRHPELVGKLYAACDTQWPITDAKKWLKDVSKQQFEDVFLSSLTLVQRNDVKETLKRFQSAAQTIMDAADPINSAGLIRDDLSVYGIEIVGDSAQGNLPDQVIPNTVKGRPYAGTEALFKALALKPTTQGNSGFIRHFGRFIAGNHGSLIGDPEALANDDKQAIAAFKEIQQQAMAYIMTGQLGVSRSDLMTLESPASPTS